MPSVPRPDLPAPTIFGLLRARWAGGGEDSLPLTHPHITLGRGPGNDIMVENPGISSNHLEIAFSTTGATVRDLGSRNGSALDGAPLPANQPASFQPGAHLSLAGCLDLRLDPPPANLPPLQIAGPVRLLAQAGPGLLIWLPLGEPGAGCYELRQLALDPAGPPLTLGRAADNDIVLPDRVVSQRHAQITPQPDGRFALRDLGSRNGLACAGTRFTQRILQPGETLDIAGQVLLQFRADLAFVTQAAEPSTELAAAAPVLTPVPAPGKMVRIGRAADNDLCIDDARVSRYHAIIERVGTRSRIRDLHSANGTFVNGKRVEQEQFLAEGDAIHIAATRLQFSPAGLERVSTAGGLRLDVLGLRKSLPGGKNLLQDISLSIGGREFVALVGTSGAGKSTLLDALNGFRPATGGRVLVNGDDLYQHFDAYRSELGYVPQDDIIHRELTVCEALDFAARLRLPADTGEEERTARVGQVLAALGLEERRSLPIHKLSGGQRKRVSIGVELLTRPRLFFLDEATSGLDPGTELELMRLLRALTEDPAEARTVILATHATKNVMLCDKVIFLTRGGYLAFFGPPDEALAYFERYRDQEARRVKPDFEFDDIYLLIDPDQTLPGSATEAEKLAVAAEWAERYRCSPQFEQYVAGPLRSVGRAPGDSLSDGLSRRRRPRVSALRQFAILSQRNLAVILRDPRTLGVLLIQAPLIGLISFVDRGQHQFNRVTGGVDKSLTVVFMGVIVAMLFGALDGAREISKEIPIYRRERMLNLALVPYVLSKVFICGVFCLYQVAIYQVFTLFTVEWPLAELSAWNWGQIYLTLVLTCLSGALFGLLLSALAGNDTQAVALIPVVLIPQMLFAGVLSPERAKSPLLPAITTSRYAVKALATITRADLSGSQNPDAASRAAAEREVSIAQRALQAGDRAVAERLDGLVKQQLPAFVQQQTDQAVAKQTKVAQDQAEALARQEMARQLVQPLPMERDRQVALARQKAAGQVAANRSEIEAQVRKQAEPALRAQAEAQMRAEAAAQVRAAAGTAAGGAANQSAGENPTVKAAHDHFGEIFTTNVYADWGDMLAIMLAVLGLIFWLQKRKDTQALNRARVPLRRKLPGA